MTLLRWLLVIVALALWGAGMYVLITSSYLLGGALILAGGLCLVLAATRGWSDLVEGATNWLYFWR